jgi:hypothetical protein
MENLLSEQKKDFLLATALGQPEYQADFEKKKHVLGSGHISGALQFSLLKGLISILEAPYKFIQCLGGYGKLVVRTKERFSFGYCFGTA